MLATHVMHFSRWERGGGKIDICIVGVLNIKHHKS